VLYLNRLFVYVARTEQTDDIALCYGLDNWGFDSRRGLGIFSPPQRPDRL